MMGPLEFSPYDSDARVLADIRELLYLLVLQADVERNRGEWPALKRFQQSRMRRDHVESK